MGVRKFCQCGFFFIPLKGVDFFSLPLKGVDFFFHYLREGDFFLKISKKKNILETNLCEFFFRPLTEAIIYFFYNHGEGDFFSLKTPHVPWKSDGAALIKLDTSYKYLKVLSLNSHPLP